MSDTTTTPETGRNPDGKFAPGNKGGPGNPYARQTAAMRKAIAGAITADDLAGIAKAMIEKAKEGDVAAARLVFSYAAGLPAAPADPDTLDRHELDTLQANTATPTDHEAMKAMPAAMACVLAPFFRDCTASSLARQFVDGLRPKDEGQAEAAPAITPVSAEALREFVEETSWLNAKKKTTSADERPAPMANGSKPSTNGHQPSANGRHHRPRR